MANNNTIYFGKNHHQKLQWQELLSTHTIHPPPPPRGIGLNNLKTQRNELNKQQTINTFHNLNIIALNWKKPLTEKLNVLKVKHVYIHKRVKWVLLCWFLCVVFVDESNGSYLSEYIDHKWASSLDIHWS